MKTIEPRPLLQTLAGQVLVVEDDPYFGEQLIRVIQQIRPHFQVLVCPTGSGAFRTLEDPGCRLNLALVDVGLPDMSGLEVIRAVTQRFEDLPVLVISVLTSERTLMEAIRAGAQGYILKGERDDVLAQSIREVLDGHFPISPLMARALFKLAGSPLAPSERESFQMTAREHETLKYLSQGYSYKEISHLMKIELPTVQTNVRKVYRKLGVNSRISAVIKARSVGLIA